MNDTDEVFPREADEAYEFASSAGPTTCFGPPVHEDDPTLVAQLSGYCSHRQSDVSDVSDVSEPPFDPKPPVDLTPPPKRKAPRRSPDRPPWAAVMGTAFPTAKSLYEALRALRESFPENSNLPRKEFQFVMTCIAQLDPDPDAVFGEGWEAVQVVREGTGVREIGASPARNRGAVWS